MGHPDDSGGRPIRSDDPTIDDARPAAADLARQGSPDSRGAGLARLESYLRQVRARGDDAARGPVEASPVPDTTIEGLRDAVEEIRRFEAALRDSKAEVEAERSRYRDLLDLSPDAYLVTDLVGRVREANRAALDLFNIRARFFVNRPLFGLLHEEDRPGFRRRVARARAAIGPVEYDVRIKPRRLPPLDASIRIGVERDGRGRPVALRWTIRDVSARKRAERQIEALNDQLEALVAERSEQLGSALEANERWLIKAHAAEEGPEGRFFRDIVEEVDAILWRADSATGRYDFVSRRAEELLGYPASRWLEEPGFWLEIVHPEDREFIGTYRRKQLREGLAHEGEYRVVAADGRTLWFREAVRPLPAGARGPASLYGLMVNISKRKKVERQLYTAKGELASRLRDLDYLHELTGRLAGARDLAATSGEVLAAVASLLGADLAMLWILEPTGGGAGAGRPALAAGLGLPEAFARRSELGGFAPEMIPAGPVTIEDSELHPEDSAWRLAGRLAGFRSAAVVPLGPGGVPLGSIVAGFKIPHRPLGRQAELVGMYATRAAEAIESALAFERLRRSDRGKAEALDEAEAALAAALAAVQADPAGAREAIEAQARRLRRVIDAG